MIDKLFRLVKAGRYRLVGRGSSRVQLVYVEDLAHAIAETALRPGLDGAEFICTYREPITLRGLSILVAEIAGRPLPALGVPLGVARAAGLAFETLEKLGFRFPGGEPPVTREKLQTVTVDRAYNIEHMRGLLGWEPPTPYEEGLRRTAAALPGAGS
jgi:nucleoside-diphosphate-sugar epimerase